MVPAREVRELPARRRGDDQLAGVRVRERGGGARGTIREVREGGEREILAVAPGA